MEDIPGGGGGEYVPGEGVGDVFGAGFDTNAGFGPSMWDSFDSSTLSIYSTLPYPTLAGVTDPDLTQSIRQQQYAFLAALASIARAKLVEQGLPLPAWASRAQAPGTDIFGNEPGWPPPVPRPDAGGFSGGPIGPEKRETIDSVPPVGVQEFLTWFDSTLENTNYVLFHTLVSWEFSGLPLGPNGQDTRREQIIVGPADNPTGAYDVDDIYALQEKYGIETIDLVGMQGMGILDTAARTGLVPEVIFDLAVSTDRRPPRQRVEWKPGTPGLGPPSWWADMEAKWDDRHNLDRAAAEYQEAIGMGYNHLQAKVYVFGTPQLAERLAGIDAGTIESQLTTDELNEVLNIWGPNWYNELNNMGDFEGKDIVGARRFHDYAERLMTQGPISIPGEDMVAAARTLSQGWRVTPLSDSELEQMINDFGASMQASRVTGGVWDQTAPVGWRAEPSPTAAVQSAIRGSADYGRLYGEKPAGMSEEDWISKFSGASSELMGSESRAATEVGMQTGSAGLARQAALTDPSARTGTYWRRIAAWRKAFQ